MIEFKHLDLFSGIGGFSVAFQEAGFKTIALAETDAHASRVLAKKFPGIPNLGDVRKIGRRAYECDPMGTLVKAAEEEIDLVWCPRCNADFADCDCIGADQFTDTYGWPHVITGGFPCQDISVAHNCGGKGKYDRKTKGLAGERSGLWWEFFRIIREFRPVFCLIENVPNLRTHGADEILSALESQNYAAESFVVGAWAFGADHERNRALIAAYDKSVRMEGLRPARLTLPQSLAETLLPVRNRDGQWEIEPDLRRAPDGVSNWTHRLRMLGNSVVPQVIYPFAKFFNQQLKANYANSRRS